MEGKIRDTIRDTMDAYDVVRALLTNNPVKAIGIWVSLVDRIGVDSAVRVVRIARDGYRTIQDTEALVAIDTTLDAIIDETFSRS